MGTFYKYLGFDSNFDKDSGNLMLSNSNLQFTRASKLNDPFDCDSELLDFTRYEVDYEMQYGEPANQIELFEQSREGYMVCSLSRTYKSLLMWSYYNQHKGICLGLDVEKVLDCLKRDYPKAKDFLTPFDVTYSEEFSKLDYAKHQEDSFRYIIRQKAIDWCHEREVRMIVHAALINGDMFYGDDYWRPKIDGDCFTSIYLGAKIEEVYKEMIIDAAQSLNHRIQIFQMQKNPNAFTLDSIKL